MEDRNSKQPPVSADESYDFGSPSSGYDNPWRERTLGREAFYPGAAKGGDPENLKRDGEARCFVIRRAHYRNIYAGVQFWLQVGLRDNLEPIAAPFFSAARLNQGWTYKSQKSGKDVLGIKNGPVKLCALARLVKFHPELIAPLKFKGQVQYWPAKDGEPAQPKLDYKKLFALEIFEVMFEYKEVPDQNSPGQTRRIVVADPATGKPKYTINPKPFIWELNETWWDQLRAKVLAPKFAQALEPKVADIDGEAPKPVKQLPTSDPSQVVLKLFAKTDEKDASKASYLVDFSTALTIDSAAIKPEDELPSLADGTIDWNEIYKPMTEEDAQDLISKASESGGEARQEGPPAGGGQGGGSHDGPPPSTDDDIPF